MTGPTTSTTATDLERERRRRQRWAAGGLVERERLRRRRWVAGVLILDALLLVVVGWMILSGGGQAAGESEKPDVVKPDVVKIDHGALFGGSGSSVWNVPGAEELTADQRSVCETYLDHYLGEGEWSILEIGGPVTRDGRPFTNSLRPIREPDRVREVCLKLDPVHAAIITFGDKTGEFVDGVNDFRVVYPALLLKLWNMEGPAELRHGKSGPAS